MPHEFHVGIFAEDKSPYLVEKVGDDIITASGTTLLGADEKTGVAIIVTAAEYLLRNSDLPWEHSNRFYSR